MPLSRDHHFGLLFCWKIRQGIKQGVDANRIKQYILYYRDNHLNRHFQLEEDILFLSEEDPYCGKAIKEHRQIALCMKAIETSNTSTDQLLALADMVDAHIRYEERELFPYLENKYTAKQLSAIGAVLQKLPPEERTDKYNDEFWTNGKS